ncbi:MAG: ATP-binding protein [Gemmatimonadota bacterium]|nr:ATP-binding protein [Chloroflexota bacterium]
MSPGHAAAERLPTPAEAPFAPPVPGSLADTGLSAEALTELILKTLYAQGARTGQHLCDAIRLPFDLLDVRLLDLQQRQLVEVRGAQGHSRGGYLFDLTGKGRERAREAMATNQYVGPAPVPLDQYRLWIELQSIRDVRVTRDAIRQGFSHLVLDPAFLEQLGPAINSAKSMFLYGDSGNGKTNLAESIARMLGGDIFVPYAVDVEGQIIVVYDPVYHRPPTDPEPEAGGTDASWLRATPLYDHRFARVTRPVVFTGGELTLSQLDLEFDPQSKLYQAPFQVKANGGVLIIDDFGRQRVRPRDLLNRWIVPLEKRVDFLTLHTGHKFPVPFDCLLIFATNLDPNDLVDEAFLRRIHYKMNVPNPTYAEYQQIFRRCCVARQIPYDATRVDHIFTQYYTRLGISPRSCHPRDVLDHLVDTARFLQVTPTLAIPLLDRACRSYFLDMPEPGGGEGGPEVQGDRNDETDGVEGESGRVTGPGTTVPDLPPPT